MHYPAGERPPFDPVIFVDPRPATTTTTSDFFISCWMNWTKHWGDIPLSPASCVCMYRVLPHCACDGDRTGMKEFSIELPCRFCSSTGFKLRRRKGEAWPANRWARPVPARVKQMQKQWLPSCMMTRNAPRLAAGAVWPMRHPVNALRQLREVGICWPKTLDLGSRSVQTGDQIYPMNQGLHTQQGETIHTGTELERDQLRACTDAQELGQQMVLIYWRTSITCRCINMIPHSYSIKHKPRLRTRLKRFGTCWR